MVMDVSSKKFTQLTDYNGLDSWPMWGTDGVYFVSDRDGNGLTNIWRVGADGGKAEKITLFKAGDVRWPAISSDGRVIVFEHDFGVWKLDVASRKATPISLNIAAETQDNLVEMETFASQADDYDLSPSSTKSAFSIHGEIFTAPVEEGDIRQITDSPARERSTSYSPDGKTLAYISDRSGREEIYLTPADGSGEAQQITDMDTLKLGYSWSPDSKEIAFVTSNGKLLKVTPATKQVAQLDSSVYGNIGTPRWSPDGKWLAYSKSDITRTSDIYLISTSGAEKEAHKVTFDSSSENNPHFSPDGRKLFFERSEAAGDAARNSVQIYSIALEKLDRDPDDPEERPDTAAAGNEGAPQGRNTAANRQPPREIKIDWVGLKRRTRQVTRMPFPVSGYTVAPDSRTLVFVTSEPAGTNNVAVVYSIQDDGKRLSRILSGQAQSEEGGPGGGGGFGGGISELNISRDGRTLFFREREGIYSVPIAAQAAAAPAGAARGEGTRKRINFNVKVRVDHSAEWAEMFDDAWRTMKYRFYDPQMHGHDWDAMRAKYQPLVEYVGDRQELLNIINEMIGELNASHTGAAPPPRGREGGVATSQLGVELEADDSAGRYKVTHVYEDGPADKDWVKVSAGDYLIAINGKPVKAGDNYWELLNYKLNRKIDVMFNNKPSEDGAWKTRIEPVNQQAYSQLRYERWVN